MLSFSLKSGYIKSIIYPTHLFHANVGDSVINYIRKRRLAKAADELIHTKSKVIEIALNNSFNSQDTFIRAFKRVYGVTPGEYRRKKISLKLHEKADLLKTHVPEPSSIKAEKQFLPRVVYKHEFMVIGVQTCVSLK